MSQIEWFNSHSALAKGRGIGRGPTGSPRTRTRFFTEIKQGSPLTEPKQEGRCGSIAHTQIICTIGPKTNSVEAIEKLIRAGMTVARLNFSHGTYEYHASVIKNVREAARRCGMPVALMLDTKGPEIRTGKLKGGRSSVPLTAGQSFTFTTDTSVEGDEARTSLTYDKLATTVQPGDTILVDDGTLIFRVESIVSDTEVLCTVINSGQLGSTKGTNIPGRKIDLPALTERDKQDLQFGLENDIDIIAASWIRTAENIEEIRRLPGVKESRVMIIAKIESQEGLDNFEEILAAADGIMVARGDLGTEIPIEKIANAQKMMIARCNVVAKPVITATQMLDSMIRNPRPTRAEATDVANAVIDGTDCVMLSGETAFGLYPTEAVEIMDKICIEAEKELDHRGIYRQMRAFTIGDSMGVPESIASSAVKSAYDVDAAAIIVFTDTGQTARLVAKYRPHVPIIVVTASKRTLHQVLLSRGTIPILVESMHNTQRLLDYAKEWGKSRGLFHPGDRVVVTVGYLEGVPGSTNIMKIESVS